MTTLAVPTLHTPQDVLRLEDQALYELVNGVLVEKRMSRKSTRVVGKFALKLGDFLEDSSIGEVLPEQSYRCFPHEFNRVRRPDISVILTHRFVDDPQWDGHITIRPDLVVEVVSPDDLAEDVEEKIEDYRRAGVPLIWIAYPGAQALHVYTLDRKFVVLRPGDRLTGEPILPGFAVDVAALLPDAPLATGSATPSVPEDRPR